MVLWALAVVAGIAVIGGLALQYAISRNGPAVLSAVDRVTGGSGDAVLLAEVSTGDHPQQRLFVWGPDGRDYHHPTRPVLIFVHGGSWRSGDPEDYGFVARAFVQRGFVVVLGGYRLGEDGVYPAMLEDTASAIGWTHREIAQHGGNPDQIVIAGHSAGAYNVVMAALEDRWLESDGMAASDIAGVVGLSGPYDFFPFDSDSTKAAFGEASAPEATQPVNQISGGAPPMLLIHGEKDDLVKVRNTRELASRIIEAGGAVETQYYPEMTHNDPLISLASPWRSRRDVADRMAEFAKDAIGRKIFKDRVSVPVQAETR